MGRILNEWKAINPQSIDPNKNKKRCAYKESLAEKRNKKIGFIL
jgi:hypothetical protein